MSRICGRYLPFFRIQTWWDSLRWNTRFFPQTFSHKRCFFGFSPPTTVAGIQFSSYCSYLQHLKSLHDRERFSMWDIWDTPLVWIKASQASRPKARHFLQAQFASLLWISQRTTWALPPSKAWWWPCSCDCYFGDNFRFGGFNSCHQKLYLY